MFYDKREQEIAYIIYCPVNWHIDIDKLITTFPAYIREKILYKEKYATSIIAPCKDRDLIDFLDKTLDIKKCKFTKTYKIEIKEKLIDKFPFYSIDPKQLIWPKDLVANVTRSQRCEYDCWIGNQLIPPIILKKRFSSDLASTLIFSDPSITLIISEELCDKLQKNNIRGFKYHELCRNKSGNITTYRRVTIEPQILINASSVLVKEKCNHNVIQNADYFDCFIDEEQVNNYDVYSVKGVRVKNILHEKLFYYNRFQWGISAKLLRLFLEMPKEKMQLQPLTYFWGEKFSPVITRQIISRLDIIQQR